VVWGTIESLVLLTVTVHFGETKQHKTHKSKQVNKSLALAVKTLSFI